MWINVEVWDAVAKDNIQLFRKGATLNGLGTLIFNKWIDKSSGEERKQFKHRLLKVLSKEEMSFFEETDFETKIAAKADELDSRPSQESPKFEKPIPITQAAAQSVQPNYDNRSPQKSKQPVQQVQPYADSATNVERVSAYTNKNSEEVRRQVPPPPPPPQRTAPAPTRVTYGSYDPDTEE
jgi:single-stranded DNA-binding protein